MNLYHKPADTQRHLPFTSSHPNNCKWNIPFYLAQRIYTITEINAKYLNNFENLSNLSKYQIPCFTNKARISEGPFSVTKRFTKT